MSDSLDRAIARLSDERPVSVDPIPPADQLADGRPVSEDPLAWVDQVFPQGHDIAKAAPPVTQRLWPGASNYQLTLDHGLYEIEPEHMRDIVTSGCSRCPGACCAAFQLGPLMMAEARDRVAAAGDPAPGDTELLRDSRFAVQHFRLLEAERNVYTCSAFDQESGRCTKYQERPSLCRHYACGDAVRGRPPARDAGLIALTENLPGIQAWRSGPAFRTWEASAAPATPAPEKTTTEQELR